VRSGSYRISAGCRVFGLQSSTVTVAVNARQRVDLVMTPGTVTESIVITDAAQLLETDSSVRGQVVQRDQIVSLPLNGRSYANLALLTPGVKESSQNAATGGGREASFNVNGLRNTVNNFLLDGVDSKCLWHEQPGDFRGQVVQVSPDAIQEFKVQTNTYSAEFGRSGGAVINAAYRSGTNQFHGNVWEFHRNTVLNAVGFFKPASGTKPPLIRNQFGITFGGPIIKDRTFFFLDYEGFRQVQKDVVFSTLPSLEQRQGRLAAAVRDPLTGTVYAAGTVIPMTSFAQKVLTDLPAPNVPNAVNNNYRELVESPSTTSSISGLITS
jgi:hypothetical protein